MRTALSLVGIALLTLIEGAASTNSPVALPGGPFAPVPQTNDARVSDASPQNPRTSTVQTPELLNPALRGGTFSRSTSTFSRTEGTFSRPTSTFSRPEGTFSRPTSTFSPQEGTFSRPTSTFSPQEGTFSPPVSSFSRPPGTFGRPTSTFSRPEETFGRPASTFSNPAPTFNPSSGVIPTTPSPGAQQIDQPIDASASSPNRPLVLDLPPGATVRKPGAPKP
jgi:hypothetical protein